MANAEAVLDADEEISRSNWLDVAVKMIALAQRKLVELETPLSPSPMAYPRAPGGNQLTRRTIEATRCLVTMRKRNPRGD